MRLQKPTTPPPWLNRRDQYRMLGMLTMLLLIMLAIDVARKPENWNWFFALSGQPQDAGGLHSEGIDFRIKEPETLPSDTLLSPAPPDEQNPGIPEEAADLRQLPRSWFSAVEDQRLGRMRNDDIAVERVLQRLNMYSQDQLLQAGERDVGYRVVNVEPQLHRGELLYLTGTLWRFGPYPFGERNNPHDDLYQAWILTEDSGNDPWLVLLAERPPGLEFGNAIDRPVTLAGYFIKRYGYPTQAGFHVAPMLVAKTLSLPPTLAVQKQQTNDVTYYAVAILSGVALFFAAVISWFLLSDRKFKRSHLAQIAERRRDAPPDAVASLRGLTAVDPTETFRQLQQKESGSSAE